jgi:hypothetical protein
MNHIALSRLRGGVGRGCPRRRHGFAEGWRRSGSRTNAQAGERRGLCSQFVSGREHLNRPGDVEQLNLGGLRSAAAELTGLVGS